MQNKECKSCGVVKPVGNFSKLKSSEDGLGYYCKECHNLKRRISYSKNIEKERVGSAKKYQKNPGRFKTMRSKTKSKEWREKNKNHLREYNKQYNIKNKERIKIYNIESSLKKKFNLTLEDYNKLLKSQNNCCLICGTEGKDDRRLAVDHCHNTGIIRGLLCGRCNMGIGAFKEDTNLLNKAIGYINYGNNSTNKNN